MKYFKLIALGLTPFLVACGEDPQIRQYDETLKQLQYARKDHSANEVSEAEISHNGCQFIEDSNSRPRLLCRRFETPMESVQQTLALNNYMTQLENRLAKPFIESLEITQSRLDLRLIEVEKEKNRSLELLANLRFYSVEIDRFSKEMNWVTGAKKIDSITLDVLSVLIWQYDVNLVFIDDNIEFIKTNQAGSESLSEIKAITNNYLKIIDEISKDQKIKTSNFTQTVSTAISNISWEVP